MEGIKISSNGSLYCDNSYTIDTINNMDNRVEELTYHWHCVENQAHETENKITNVMINQDGLSVRINTCTDRLSEIEEYINYLKEKERKNMIEGNQIVRLWVKNQEEAIEAKYKEEMQKYQESNVFVAQYEALMKDFMDKMNALYASQIPEGTLERDIDKNTLAIIRAYEDEDMQGIHKITEVPFKLNTYYKDDKMKNIMNERDEKLNAIHKKAYEIETLLGICKTRDEILDVLKNYDIVDKKGMLKNN